MKSTVKIGKFLNRALKLRNVSQKEIASVLGVNPNIISYFCHDKRIPNTQQIIDIAEYLNVSTDYLLGRSEISSSNENVQIACDVTGLPEKIIELFHEYNEHEKAGNFTSIEYDDNGNICKGDFILKNFNRIIKENEEIAEYFRNIILALSALNLSSTESAEYFINKIESGEQIVITQYKKDYKEYLKFEYPMLDKNCIIDEFNNIIGYFCNPKYIKIYSLIKKKMLCSSIIEIDKDDPDFLAIKT